MAKIFDLAQTAGVTPRTLLDVVNGRAVNEDARRRVAAAIEELGQPDQPVGAFRHVDVVAGEDAALPVEDGSPREDVVHAAQPAEPKADGGAIVPVEGGLQASTSELAAALLEALRAEVRPVASRLDELDVAVAEVVRLLRLERRRHADDLELLSELVIEGWRGVDRRLGRVEKILSRVEETQQTAAPKGRSVKRLEDWIKG